MDDRLNPVKNETCSEIVNSSARLSPFEDFRRRSLNGVRGQWRRLLYLASLRRPEGGYDHWGLARTYGREKADTVLGGAHSEAYIQLLRTPFSELMQDIETPTTDSGTAIDDLLEAVSNGKGKMVPAELIGGAPRHFSSVVLAACALRSAQRASTRPTS